MAKLQPTLIISTSLNSNNRLSGSENLVPIFSMETLQQVTKYCEKEEKLGNFSSFPQYFKYISYFGSQIAYSFVKCGCLIYFFLNSTNLIHQGTDI